MDKNYFDQYKEMRPKNGEYFVDDEWLQYDALEQKIRKACDWFVHYEVPHNIDEMEKLRLEARTWELIVKNIYDKIKECESSDWGYETEDGHIHSKELAIYYKDLLNMGDKHEQTV